ncbi:hypothetical protein HY2_07860 [Hyphomonas pacifica]|nr:hypothetical protein HY2_07860 [Hyphomonas pacifica]
MEGYFLLKKTMIFALLANVTACATTYTVPSEEAPPEWREDGKPMGFGPVEGSAKSFPGTLKENDAMMEFLVENERTAIITDALEWTDPYGGTNIIPAGSPAYARQFSLQISSTYSFRKNLNEHNNPIEWCVPRFDKKDAVCIFWEGSEQARYIETSGGTPQNAKPLSPSGMVGPMPHIEEQAVDFEHPMKIQVVVDMFRSDWITVATRVSEGDDWSSLGRSKVKFDEDGTATISRFQGEFKLTADRRKNGKITGVKVEVFKEPKAVRMATFEDVVKMLMLLKAAEAETNKAPEEGSANVDSETTPVEE